MFRISGNVSLESSEIVRDRPFRVNVNQKKHLLSFVQYLKPLSVDNPYFSVSILNSKPDSCITIGIASSDISENSSPGLWTNTVGYESATGRCLSSHRPNANTVGRVVNKGDSFGLLVTHFGKFQSTVVFLLNDEPIATRYHFESDQSKYLPTITFENGPIEVDIMWPSAIEPAQIPLLVDDDDDHKSVKWITPSSEECLSHANDEFENIQKSEDMPIQSSVSLSKSRPQYRCIQLDVSTEGQAASVGIASCSPLKPTPACSLLRDYYTWLPKMKLKPGNTIGWGVFYNPDQQTCDQDRSEQLVLVFVTLNDSIIDVLFVLQPEGGFYPLVLMQPWAKRVKVELLDSISTDDATRLTKYFRNKFSIALDTFQRDVKESSVYPSDMRCLGDVNIDIIKTKTVIKIGKQQQQLSHQSAIENIYYVQYKRPLTPERRFFFVEIVKIDVSSNVVVGVTSQSTLDECKLAGLLPGQVNDTVGYFSKSGLMYYNDKSNGNMMGHRCSKGDVMAIEIDSFHEDMSVAIFSKNFRPIGTRFLTQKDMEQFLPTIAIVGGGGGGGGNCEEIELNVYWQTVVSMPPHYNVRTPVDWCCPEGTKVDLAEKTFLLPHHYDQSLCLQAPYSLHQKFNHFEIILADDFDKNNPPPAIALCTASPFDPPPISQFKQDYLRFWPTGEAMTAVKKNDRLGWGIFYANEGDTTTSNNIPTTNTNNEMNSVSNNNKRNETDSLIVCFLTINRQVVYLRVLYQPPGGFYPVVIAPPNVYRIKMDFSATRVSTEDFAGEQIRSILMEANRQIESEKRLIAQGRNPREQMIMDDSKRSKLCSIL